MLFRRRRTAAPEDHSAEIAREVLDIAPVLGQYRGEPPPFGAPTRCPDCRSFGMVVTIVPGPVVASENECPSCRASWTITRRALRAVARAGSVPRALDELGHERRDDRKPLVTPGLVLPPAVVLAGAAPDEDELLVPAGPLSLLLVEDDPADAALLEAILEPAADEVVVQRAWSRSEGEKLSADPALDLVLLDLGLPDSSGLTTLSRWRPKRQVPLMVLSGNDNGALADVSYDYGVRNFLHKQGLFDWLEAGAEGTREMLSLLRQTAGAAPAGAPATGPTFPRVPARGTWAN